MENEFAVNGTVIILISVLFFLFAFVAERLCRPKKKTKCTFPACECNAATTCDYLLRKQSLKEWRAKGGGITADDTRDFLKNKKLF
jgi:hypothetical protein